MTSNRLQWIHLSDLHVNIEDQFDRGVVLSSLWKDIENLVAEGHQPDFIAFTGDVAYHGRPDEYVLAERDFFYPLLKVANLGKDRLFLVPGNHDVDRNTVQLLNNPMPSAQDKDAIYQLVQNANQRDLLLSPLKNYASFVRSYGVTFPDMNPLFGYRTDIAIRGFPVTIVGLNSTWLSGFNLDAHGKVDDSRRLAVTEFQLRNCTLGASRLMVVLMHHPPDWLMEPDQLLVEQLLANRHAILLRGHLHRPDVLSTTNLDGSYVSIPAGAVFDRRKSPNAYNFVRVDLNSRVGTIYFRRYSDRRIEWQKDIESTGDKLDGRLSFRIPSDSQNGPILTYRSRRRPRVRIKLCFTERCRSDLRSLKLTEAAVRSLLQAEFDNYPSDDPWSFHVYPLLLASDYLISVKKVGKRVELGSVVACTTNQEQVAAWRSIIAHYKSLISMSYRDDPSAFASAPGRAMRVSELHQQLAHMMEEYYAAFKAAGTDDRRHQPLRKHNARGKVDNQKVYFHLDLSQSACCDVKRVLELVNGGDIEPAKAVGLLVAALEQSLQHIHKLIVLYPPRGD